LRRYIKEEGSQGGAAHDYGDYTRARADREPSAPAA
jgi:hypothetical protein